MFNDRYGLTDAVIEGRKTMTRRLINSMPKDCAAVHKNCRDAYWSDEPMSLVVDQGTGGVYCKYCGNGVRFWDGGYHNKARYKVGEIVAVAQCYNDVVREFTDLAFVPGSTNKMFVRADLMPHQIRITGIRVERLQDITDEDCIREGIRFMENSDGYFTNGMSDEYTTPREAFAALINAVSGKGTWKKNPWVVVYEFELLK